MNFGLIRKTKRIILEYLGIQTDGETIKEARQKAAQHIEKLVRDLTCSPRVIVIKGHTLLISRTVYCWFYMLTRPGDNGVINSSSHGYDTREEAESAARCHLAQNLFDFGPTDGDEGVILDEKDRAEHRDWAGWQRRVRAWIELGKSDTEAQDLASRRLSPETLKKES